MVIINTKNRRYFTFKHAPGQNKTEEECKKYVEWAFENNAALMQYEYNFQISNNGANVTSNWHFIKDNLKEGDVLFLRGGEYIYAVGEVCRPRKPADIILNMQSIIEDRDHGKYNSGESKLCIHFNDCPVFYEDLSDGQEEWGQRIDVQSWDYYSPQGIYCKDMSNYVEGSERFNVLMELKKESAFHFFEELKKQYYADAK